VDSIDRTEHPIQERVYHAKGNGLVADALIQDYLPYIKAEASKATKRIVTEQDDEFSIAMIGFHEAIESYSKMRGAFLKYAAVVIRNKLTDYYRKEKRHMGQLSISAPAYGDEDVTLGDTLKDETDIYNHIENRSATQQEIIELARQLGDFGLSLNDIADNCPKQDRTLESCRKALTCAVENPELILTMKRTKKLPISALVEGSGVERKTIERHRKYLMALLLIYSNGYEVIRGHLKQVMNLAKGVTQI
jgi:RNA polymerase sigma factor